MSLKTTPLAVVFLRLELALAAVGLILAYLVFGGFPPLRWTLGPRDLLLAAAGSVPVLLFAALATSPAGLKLRPLRSIYEALRDSPIGDYLRDSRWPAFLALSIAAGFSEEFLFRGVLQAKIGLWPAAAVFGLLHALSWTYLAIATAIGAYLGWLFQVSGNALLVPTIIHALYDFVALLLYKRRMDSNR